MAVDPLGKISERMTELVRRSVETNVRFYQELTELTTGYIRSVGQILTETPVATTVSPGAAGQAPAAPPAPVFLEAEAGQTAVAQFMVANDLPRDVSASIEVAPFVDASGQTVDLTVAVEPRDLSLKQGERAVVKLAATIDDRIGSGMACRGSLSVPGLSDTPVPVVVRRLHTIEVKAKEPEAKPPAAAKRKAKTARKRKATKKRAAAKRKTKRSS